MRAAAMSMPGRDLSQPAKVSSPSKRSACITVSTESAITSRLTNDARMPSWPMEMPSDTAMVTNSNGNPPASRTPSLERLASRSSGMLQGVTSFQLLATPICGLSQSASVIPTARSMARAGARVGPSVTSKLRGLSPSRSPSSLVMAEKHTTAPLAPTQEESLDPSDSVRFGSVRFPTEVAKLLAAAATELGHHFLAVGLVVGRVHDRLDEEALQFFVPVHQTGPLLGVGRHHLGHGGHQGVGAEGLETQLLRHGGGVPAAGGQQ